MHQYMYHYIPSTQFIEMHEKLCCDLTRNHMKPDFGCSWYIIIIITSVTTSRTDSPSRRTWCFEIYLNFELQKSLLKKSRSATFWIQILPNKFHEILLIKSFPTTPKGTFQFLQNLQLYEKIIQYYIELLHSKSKWRGTKPMHTSFHRKLSPKTNQEHDLKHPSSVDLKQNKTKQSTFLHSFIHW
jgi:hypothetical protein